MSRAHLIALLLLLSGCGSETTTWHGRNLHTLMPDLAFTLHDGNDRQITAADYAGKVVLLYFGYAHCDDVCPTTLTTLAHAVHSLGNEADRVRILFVSVDPRRDTPEVLRHHSRHFSPQLVGLSGSEAQLQALAKRYRVAYGYGAPGADGAYQVYHSSAIFVFDARGHTRLLLEERLGAAAIAQDLRQLLITP
ncbi:MAG TPA: SCO family protein [Gammaproteobacteria bacterium]